MKRFQRKIDIVNLVMMVLISGVGGFVSFWLVTWAQSVTGFWAALAWLLAGLWTLAVLLFVLVGGLQQLFKNEEAESSE